MLSLEVLVHRRDRGAVGMTADYHPGDPSSNPHKSISVFQ